MFSVWLHDDKEYHFRQAMRAFDASSTIQSVTFDEYFMVETKLEEADIARLTSVKKVSKHVPMDAPSGIVFAMQYQYGYDHGREEKDGSDNHLIIVDSSGKIVGIGDMTGDDKSANKLSRYAEVSHLLGSSEFYRYVKFGDLPNLLK